MKAKAAVRHRARQVLKPSHPLKKVDKQSAMSKIYEKSISDECGCFPLARRQLPVGKQADAVLCHEAETLRGS